MATAAHPLYWRRFFGPMGRGLLLALVIMLNGVFGAAQRDEAVAGARLQTFETSQHLAQCDGRTKKPLPAAPHCRHVQCCVLCSDDIVSIARAVVGVAIDALHFKGDDVAPMAARDIAPAARSEPLTAGSPRSPPAAA